MAAVRRAIKRNVVAEVVLRVRKIAEECEIVPEQTVNGGAIERYILVEPEPLAVEQDDLRILSRVETLIRIEGEVVVQSKDGRRQPVFGKLIGKRRHELTEVVLKELGLRRAVDQRIDTPRGSDRVVERKRPRCGSRRGEHRPRVVEKVASFDPLDPGPQEVVVCDRTGSPGAATADEQSRHGREHLVEHLGHAQDVEVADVSEHEVRFARVGIRVRRRPRSTVDIACAVGDEDFVPVGHGTHVGIAVEQRVDLIGVERLS